MRLTIVGSAPAYALRPGHAASCYLVESGDTAVLFDLGQGAFAALGTYLEPSTLDAIFVSHLHPDHGIDIVPLRHYLRYAFAEPRTLRLHAPAEFRTRIDALHGEDGFLECMVGEPLAEGSIAVGPLDILARPVAHSLNSFGFRVTDGDGDGPGLVYSGDCGQPDDLAALIHAGDTVLAEASWGAAQVIPTGALHLTAQQSAEVARDRGAARLLLTHVLDEYDPKVALAIARATFPGPVDLALPGGVVEVG